MRTIPPIPGPSVSPLRPFAGFPAAAMAGQADPARTVFYQYTPPKPKNPEVTLGWVLTVIAFVAAGFPVFGIGMYLVGILLSIAGIASGCVGASRGARWSGTALALASIAAVPAGIRIAPWLSGLFA